MALVHIDIPACPSCRTWIDFRLAGLCSKLGPPLVVCCGCGQPAPTGRLEWSAMTGRSRRRYVLFSLLYILVGGLMGGFVFTTVHHAFSRGVRNGLFPAEPGFGRPLFWLGVVFWAGLLTAIQVGRVLASRKRTLPFAIDEEQDHSGKEALPPCRRHLLLNFGWQFPMMYPLVGPLLLSWLLAYFIVRP